MSNKRQNIFKFPFKNAMDTEWKSTQINELMELIQNAKTRNCHVC